MFWLSLTRNQLLDSCGHYLIYGSEFICGIAAELNCQYVLKNKGIPTIFHCDVPLEKIPSNYIADLNRQIQNGNGNNCGFKIFGAVTRDQIINYENPDKIFDPLNRFLPYRFKEIFE
ncbi:hypothetical protein [Paenibacillus cellulosilyticus]|uniref:hypothetical protein n=1 Tax=Paenibacillus cellulosilyticus TaxID=375489 RepID=UPI001C64329E|nr:hypothetical protein [Paenibacillus cellulosilyticus]